MSYSLSEAIDRIIKQRDTVVTYLDKIFQHHVVKENFQIYLNSRGGIECRFVGENNNEHNKMNAMARINQVYDFLQSYNDNYYKLLDAIRSLPADKQLEAMEKVLETSNKYLDDFYSRAKKKLTQLGLVSENFDPYTNYDEAPNENVSRKFSQRLFTAYIRQEQARIDYIKNNNKELLK